MAVSIDSPAMYFVVFVFKDTDLPVPASLDAALKSFRARIRQEQANVPQFLHITVHLRDYLGSNVEFGVSVVGSDDPAGPIKMPKSGLSLVIIDLTTSLDVDPALIHEYVQELKDGELKAALHYELCKVSKL